MNNNNLTYNGYVATINDIYTMLFNYKGYGNPNGKYWFIGMEENWKETNKENIFNSCEQDDIKYYEMEITPIEFALKGFCKRLKVKKTFEKGIYQLIEKLVGKELQDKVLEKEVFVANARFAPYQTYKKIKEIFGIEMAEHKKAEQLYKKQLFELWQKNNPEKTFCLSKQYTEEFIQIFNDKNLKIIQNNEDAEQFIRVYELNNRRICQIYHPSAAKFTISYINKIL